MPFRFALQSVLDYRQSVEHQQELRLRAVNQQLAKVRRLMQLADARIRNLQAERSGILSTGTTSAELLFIYSAEASARAERRHVERELSRVANLRDQQQRIFQRARRERETLESLREQQWRDYDRERRRRAQRQLDDLFLLQRTLRKHS